jgi:site-specific recombinase XerD
MNQLAIVNAPGVTLPALVAAADEKAQLRFLEFYAVAIRNPNTRRAYIRAAVDFLGWCEEQHVRSIVEVQPLHVAAWVELLTRQHAAPTAKQRLAGIRHLFDWLVTGQILSFNPASSVRGPAHRVRRGKTPVLSPQEARQLLDSIDVSTPIGLRDRALIALMVYSFARVGATEKMLVCDAYVQKQRLWVRLHEKGGKEHQMPCHHNLEEYLLAYIDGCRLRNDPKAPLFPTVSRSTGELTKTPLPQSNAHAMVRRRAKAAGIATLIGNHSFRADRKSVV